MLVVACCIFAVLIACAVAWAIDVTVTLRLLIGDVRFLYRNFTPVFREPTNNSDKAKGRSAPPEVYSYGEFLADEAATPSKTRCATTSGRLITTPRKNSKT